MRKSVDVLRSLARYGALALGDEWEMRLWGTEGEFKFPFVRAAIVTPMTFKGVKSYTDCTMGLALHCYPTPGASPEDSIIEVERVKELLWVAFENGVTYPDLTPPTDTSVSLIPEEGDLPGGSYAYAISALGALDGETRATQTVTTGFDPGPGSLFVQWDPVRGAGGYRVYRSDNAGTEEATPFRFLADVLDDIAFMDDGTVDPDPTREQPTRDTTIVSGYKHRVPLYDYDNAPLDGVDAFSFARYDHDYFRVLDFTLEHGVDPEDETQFRVIAQLRVTWRRTGFVPDGQQIVQEVYLREIVS